MDAALDDEIGQVLTLELAREKISYHLYVPGTSGRATKVHAVYFTSIIGIRSRSTSSVSTDTSFELRIGRFSCEGSFRCEHSL